jgi:hypothetical protein
VGHRQTKIESERERERQKERERDKERQRQRQRDRDRHKQRQRQRGRGNESERQTDSDRQRQRVRLTKSQGHVSLHRHIRGPEVHMTGVPQQVSVAAKSYGWDGQMPAERSRQVTVCKMIIISFRAALSEDGSQLL